jgi:DnaJ-class molecular chaperone
MLTHANAAVALANKTLELLAEAYEVRKDQLRIARQCIEACREEFMYRMNKLHECSTCKGEGFTDVDWDELPIDCAKCGGEGVTSGQDATAQNMLNMCDTALANLPTFDVSAEAKNIDDVLKQVNENTK